MIWNRVGLLQQRILQGVLQTQLRNITVSKVLRENHYDALGLKRDATLAEIKNAYFELSKIYHPDRIAATDENLAKFRAITAAYEVLGNEQSRTLYDRGLVAHAREVEAVDDPIVRFYKRRQERAQGMAATISQEEMEQWTRQIYRSARKSVAEKNELFQATKKIEAEEEKSSSRIMFLFVMGTFLVTIFCSSLEGHPIEVFFSNIFGDNPHKR